MIILRRLLLLPPKKLNVEELGDGGATGERVVGGRSVSSAECLSSCTDTGERVGEGEKKSQTF
jgi:hypothetical protein